MKSFQGATEEAPPEVSSGYQILTGRVDMKSSVCEPNPVREQTL